jgi:hypothetical protein
VFPVCFSKRALQQCFLVCFQCALSQARSVFPVCAFTSVLQQAFCVRALLQDDAIDLTEILRSFELPETQLEFTFEELYKATSMRKTVSVFAVRAHCFNLLSPVAVAVRCRCRCAHLLSPVAVSIRCALSLYAFAVCAVPKTTYFAVTTPVAVTPRAELSSWGGGGGG